MKNVNYTPEVTQAIVTTYTDAPNMDTVRALAENHGKTVKSIIGKLSREGVYQKATYTTKTGAKPITKAEIVAQITDKLDLDVESVAGLDDPGVDAKRSTKKTSSLAFLFRSLSKVSPPQDCFRIVFLESEIANVCMNLGAVFFALLILLDSSHDNGVAWNSPAH